MTIPGAVIKLPRGLFEAALACQPEGKHASGYIPFYQWQPVDSFRFPTTPDALGFLAELALRIAEATSREHAVAVARAARLDVADGSVYVYFEGVRQV